MTVCGHRGECSCSAAARHTTSTAARRVASDTPPLSSGGDTPTSLPSSTAASNGVGAIRIFTAKSITDPPPHSPDQQCQYPVSSLTLNPPGLSPPWIGQHPRIVDPRAPESFVNRPTTSDNRTDCFTSSKKPMSATPFS